MNVSYQFKPNQYIYPNFQHKVKPKQKDISKDKFKQTFCRLFNNLMTNK